MDDASQGATKTDTLPVQVSRKIQGSSIVRRMMTRRVPIFRGRMLSDRSYYG